MFEILKNLFSSPSDAALEKIITEGAFLVDVRSAGEFAAQHVKRSVNIPVDQVQNQLSKFKDKSTLLFSAEAECEAIRQNRS